MRAVFVLFDTLNRNDLGCYGGAIPTPNFDRFAARALTFDNHFVGSMPCMPARRDIHTGRMNFMHRSWGPIEPFDNSMPELLKTQGIYTHLVTDHFHYLEDGGATYHSRYSTFDIVRGQEYDQWAAVVDRPTDAFRRDYSSKHYNGPGQANRVQGQVNRMKIRSEEEYPGPQCFERAFTFLDDNRKADDWLLQVECFDPHEPFAVPEKYRKNFPTGYSGPVIDWPKYGRVTETEEEIAEIKANYAALVTMCDTYFGKLLDYFDEHDLWKDTCLIMTTDHGFLLSEHDLWGKNMTPYFDELARIPLIMHHPEWTDRQGRRTDLVTQTPDLMPTFMELFGKLVPKEVRAPSIQSRIDREDDGRTVIFGMFGGPVGAADKRYRYLLYPPNLDSEELFEYTLMPTHMKGFFLPEELESASIHPPLDFTKDMPVMRTRASLKAKRPPGPNRAVFKSYATMLFDIENDPRQIAPCEDPPQAARLTAAIVAELAAHDATEDYFAWMGLSMPDDHAAA